MPTTIEPRSPSTVSRLPFQHVDQVTEEHAEKFIEALFRLWANSGTLFEAVQHSDVTVWPSEPDHWPGLKSTPEQNAVIDSHDRIGEEFGRLIRPAAMLAFKQAAAKVLGLNSGGLSEKDRRAIRTIFLEPEELYTAPEAAELLGIPFDHYMAEDVDTVALGQEGGVPTWAVVSHALTVWSLAEIEDALGDQFSDVFDPLCASAPTGFRLPQYVVKWLEEYEAPRLSEIYARPVSVERTVLNILEDGVWSSGDDVPDDLKKVAWSEEITKRLRLRITPPPLEAQPSRPIRTR